MYKLKKVSNWITVQSRKVTPKSSMWDYVYDYDKEKDKKGKEYAFIDMFRWHNRWYPLERFINRYSVMGFDYECEYYPPNIVAYDGADYSGNELLLEVSQDGERVKLWQRD